MYIKAKNISKSYNGQVALYPLTLALNEGELVAYIGTNGAGKSTTISILSGLLKPDTGTVCWKENLKIGIVFQNSILDDECTVRNNLESRGALYRQINSQWLDKLFTIFKIDKMILYQKYGQLSGGQRRKIDLIRALMNRPNVLFLDEPTTGLDVESREQIWQVLHYLTKEQGVTIFLTTHYLEEAEQADQVYVLDKGRVLATGSSQELKESYGTNRLELVLKSGKRLTYKDVSVEEVAKLISEYQADLQDFTLDKADMNSVFMTLTGSGDKEELK